MLRPAATLCLLRPGPDGPEVLLVRRAPGATFVGGAYVFPGGAVEEADRSETAGRAVRGVPSPEQLPWMAAALRETAEEAGVWLTDSPLASRDRRRLAGLTGRQLYRALIGTGRRFDAGRLAYLSNWVTPQGPPRRFDTRFFLAAVEVETPAEPDGREVVEARWVRPARALEEELPMLAPTVAHLELLARFSDPEEAVTACRSARVSRVEPRLKPDGRGGWEVLLPDHPDYEEAAPWT